MVELAKAPGKPLDEVSEMREKLVQLEAELQRHREGRQAGEARFRLLADAAPVMIWMSGPDALCTYFNRAWLELRGRALDEETGNGWTEGLHPDDRDSCFETYLKAFGTRQPFRMRCRLRRADGEYSWVELAGVPRFEDGVGFKGFMGSAIDISEWKRGVFTPDWWKLKGSQYGMLKSWRVTREGAFVDGVKISSLTLESFSMKVSVRGI